MFNLQHTKQNVPLVATPNNIRGVTQGILHSTNFHGTHTGFLTNALIYSTRRHTTAIQHAYYITDTQHNI